MLLAASATARAEDGKTLDKPTGTPAAKPAAGDKSAPAAMLAEARARMQAITRGVVHIRNLVPRAENRGARVSCVTQRLTEARVHVQLASDEMSVLEQPAAPVPAPVAQEADQAPAGMLAPGTLVPGTLAPPSAGAQPASLSTGAPKVELAAQVARAAPPRREADREYAMRRLDLIARRTAELERAARICVEDETSGIDITRVDMQAAPIVGARAVEDPPPAPGAIFR